MPSYSIILRRYSSESERYNYSMFGSSDSLARANKIASKATGETGDILIVCDSAYISDMSNRAEVIYVIDRSGTSRRLGNCKYEFCDITRSGTWLKVWEDQDTEAGDMLHAASVVGVDHKLIAASAYDCVVASASALASAVPSKERPLFELLNKAEYWMHNKDSGDDVRGSAQIAFKMFINHGRCTNVASSFYAIYCLLSYMADKSAYSAQAAAADAASSIGESQTYFSDTVRKYIRFEDVALAVANKQLQNIVD